ncbi:MAG: Coenzyme F420 hydrogenase/dehydrogenase, beta subunit C-terminal domain [Clostridia bacterium]|nr:Coenzyme F420 hydrogenase/dehydrogenase, beta subunit C-terminal domain [Clostridia bacterium]
MEICPKKSCTGCGACAHVCPKKCISMKENDIGAVYPDVDENACVSCGKCQKVCPVLKDEGFLTPTKAYAAFSSNNEERRTSASGGIAAEIYRLAANEKMLSVGAKSNEDFSVTLELAQSAEDIKAFKNSKYVFSTAYSLYPKLKKSLEAGERIIVIGLPCQIAAVKSLFGEEENLYLVDLVCHGTTPVKYLKQHISDLEKMYGKQAEEMSFRDPDKGTAKFTFTLYDKDNNCFYAKRTMEGDTYQIGYHKGISYRENCYRCKWARVERVSDLTLCDYWGIGKAAPWELEKEKISCILVNTEKGQDIVNQLVEKNMMQAFERPLKEPIRANRQLQSPVDKSKARLDFEKYIVLSKGNFEETMANVIKRQKVRDNTAKMAALVKKPLRVLKKLFKKGS